MKAQEAIMSANGKAEVGLLKPMMAAAVAPNAICMAPIKAEAEPAFFVNGAIESAEAFGKANPWQLRNNAMSAMVLYKFSKLKAVPASNTIPTRVCTIKVTNAIC